MRRSPALLAVVLLAALLLAACGAPAAAPAAPPAEPGAAPAGATLSVFAAASLTEAFEAIGAGFEEANPGVEVIYSFAGSQQLAAQINEGAPADVFASANGAQMQAVAEGGRVAADAPRPFVRNRLVLITPADNPGEVASLADLSKPGLRLILADQAVPVGQYALDVLAKASALPEYTESYSSTVLANVVSYEESVRAVLTKVALGEADAGIVYSTDAALEAGSIAQIAIPDELNTIASYPVAALSDSPNAALAAAFVDYLLGAEAQSTLAKYGFIRIE